MVDARRLEYAGALHDPASMLAKLGVTGPVWLTMINGRVVYRDDHLTGVDVPFTSRYLRHNRSMAETRDRRTAALSTISPAQSWCC